MTKINYFEIESVDLEFLQKYFAEKNGTAFSSQFYKLFRKYVPKKNTVDNNVIYIKNERRSYNIYTDPLIKIALKYLERYRYYTTDINYKKYYIELFRYNCIGSNNELDYLDYHIDDYAVMQYKVNTVIFYLAKSDTLIGGDLLIDINNTITKIPVHAGMCLLFEGDVMHKPEPCNGSGIRDCIVVHLARDNTPITRDTPVSITKGNGPIETEL